MSYAYDDPICELCEDRISYCTCHRCSSCEELQPYVRSNKDGICIRCGGKNYSCDCNSVCHTCGGNLIDSAMDSL